MIDAKRLLTDLKRLRRTLDADLRTAHATGAHRDAVQGEWQGAFDSGRTRETFEAFLDAAFDQSVVHWVLGCVFLRFLEDNGLVDRPFLSGPSEDRRDLARERQETYFRARPHDSDAEYLLATFEEAARLPGLSGLFDPAHNPLFRLPLSGDGAMALLRFFREVVPETGALAHDFTEAEWNTRFLGDLYQDLSDDARKRYALLQTPDFVEAWILDRTLEPAIQEFGHEQLRMIDPACGSGHFLLGSFARLLREWQRHAPGLPATEQAQRALDGVAGVDLNPFAVEIARFRLLVAALRAGGVSRLASAPAFRMQLAAGDSLLHGQHFARHELGGAAEGFRRVLRHHYAAEDTAELDAILGRQYHAVVGNPPYITPKDAAMRDAYREIYTSCHMKYGLGAPFTERFFDLALQGTRDQAAGFVGLIVANSFMKREFGKKLIAEVLPRLDLTHVVDCSGAYIPGHGTPTAILFGRNRPPVASVVRTVRGVRGEPVAPENPAEGLVWSAIVAQTDQDASTSPFISTEDTPRATLSAHPWNMGGGGAAAVQEAIEEDRPFLSRIAASIGITSFTLEDDLFLLDVRSARRQGLEISFLRPMVEGDLIRDWSVATAPVAVFPYDENFESLRTLPPRVGRYMWSGRTGISQNKMFGGRTKVETGLKWFEFGRLTAEKLRTPPPTLLRGPHSRRRRLRASPRWPLGPGVRGGAPRPPSRCRPRAQGSGGRRSAHGARPRQTEVLRQWASGRSEVVGTHEIQAENHRCARQILGRQCPPQASPAPSADAGSALSEPRRSRWRGSSSRRRFVRGKRLAPSPGLGGAASDPPPRWRSARADHQTARSQPEGAATWQRCVALALAPRRRPDRRRRGHLSVPEPRAP